MSMHNRNAAGLSFVLLPRFLKKRDFGAIVCLVSF